MQRRQTELQRRIGAFENALGAHITVNDYEQTFAHEIAPSNLFHDTEYCHYVKSHPQMHGACGRFDNGAVPRALRKGHAGLCKRCHGGVFELVAPLMREDELVGTVTAGPYREVAVGDLTVPIVSSDEHPVPTDDGLYKVLPEIDAQTARLHLELLCSLGDTLVLQAHASSAVHEHDRDRSHRILHIIARRYQAKYGLSDLADELALSESRAGKVVRELFGMSFTELLQEYRVKRVRHYLERTLIPVSEIARLCGFENENYLYRLFKRFTGTTPLQHRKAHQTSFRV